MRIEADRGKCDGLGMCEAMAPDFFEVNDGTVLVLNERTDEELQTEVDEAVAGCPELALKLTCPWSSSAPPWRACARSRPPPHRAPRPVVLVGAEEHVPYDRPPLSKAFLDAPTCRMGPGTGRRSTTCATSSASSSCWARRPRRSTPTPTRSTSRRPPIGYDARRDRHRRGPQPPGPSTRGAHAAHARRRGGRPAALDAGPHRRGRRRVHRFRGRLRGAQARRAGDRRRGPGHSARARRRCGGWAPRSPACTPATAPSCGCGGGVEGVEGDGRRAGGRRRRSLPADLVVAGIGVDPDTAWLEGSG